MISIRSSVKGSTLIGRCMTYDTLAHTHTPTHSHDATKTVLSWSLRGARIWCGLFEEHQQNLNSAINATEMCLSTQVIFCCCRCSKYNDVAEGWMRKLFLTKFQENGNAIQQTSWSFALDYAFVAICYFLQVVRRRTNTENGSMFDHLFPSWILHTECYVSTTHDGLANTLFVVLVFIRY